MHAWSPPGLRLGSVLALGTIKVAGKFLRWRVPRGGAFATPAEAALTITTMPAFGSSGRPGQDEQPITSPSLWCSWLVPWAGSSG